MDNVPDPSNRIDPLALLAESFTPRAYQEPLFLARESGLKRFVTVWHRRAGKDLTWLNFVAREAFKRVGAYYYVFPTYAQGRKILWDGRDKEGRKFLNYIPSQLIEKTNDTELKITLTNGSTIQVIGADNPDSVVGTNPVGIVFSEYSLQRPTVYDLMRPILAENEGWAGFNYTPRGHNHGHDLYKMARKNAEWYCSRLTVDDTGAVPQAVIDAEREAGMAEPMVQQEFYTSFEAGVIGSIYGDQMREAEERVKFVPWEPRFPVHTAWDLGWGDTMSVGMFQVIGNEWRWIDYIDGNHKPIPHYVAELEKRSYVWGNDYVPFDADVASLNDGKTRKEVMRDLGRKPIVVKQHLLIDGINAVRGGFPKMFFDEAKCKDLVDALRNYCYEYDEERKEFKKVPDHNWASHPADMVRYAVMGYVPPKPKPKPPKDFREGVDYSGTGY
jgi:phage terminase large subunit